MGLISNLLQHLRGQESPKQSLGRTILLHLFVRRRLSHHAEVKCHAEFVQVRDVLSHFVDPALLLSIKPELPGVVTKWITDAYTERLEVQRPEFGEFCEGSSPALLSACLGLTIVDFEVEMEVLHRL